MKAKRQTNHLAKMMQEYKFHPEYELALPLFQVKKSALKKLLEEDVLLLGLYDLELILIKKGQVCASVSRDDNKTNHKLTITNLHQERAKEKNTKKYEILKCFFGTVQSRRLKVGHTVDISGMNIEEVALIAGEINIAQGILIRVDDEIAIQIKKVHDKTRLKK